MYSFCNSFRVTNKTDGTEFLMQLLQALPTYEGTSNKISNVAIEEVISIAMHPDRARDLAKTILEVLDKNPAFADPDNQE